MDEVWCSLDNMSADIAAGIHQPPPPDLHDPTFWPAFADCAASFIAGGDNACFDDLMLGGSSDNRMEGMVVAMDDDDDGSGFLVGEAEAAEHLMLSPSPSSLSSGRSLSIDSGGSMSSFSLDAAAALATIVVPQSYAPAPPVAHGLFASAGGGGAVDDHDDAIMRAMMAVISSSSASPSSSGGSASSPTPFSRDTAQQPGQPAMAPQPPPQPRGANGGHVVVKSSSSSLAVPPDQKPGGRGRQQEEARAAAAAACATNSSQLYHMMSERKRREKLNDSFHTLRSLLPPCPKKDKTTVLINAAKYLKSLETEITELEGRNTKLEKHIAGGGGADAAMRARRAQQRAKVQISKAADSQQQQLVNLTVMVMVECDVVDLVLHILECLKWMKEISVLSVDAHPYSPQVLLKAIASIKLQIMGGDWNEASFHEVMTKAANDATHSCAPLALTAA